MDMLFCVVNLCSLVGLMWHLMIFYTIFRCVDVDEKALCILKLRLLVDANGESEGAPRGSIYLLPNTSPTTFQRVLWWYTLPFCLDNILISKSLLYRDLTFIKIDLWYYMICRSQMGSWVDVGPPCERWSQWGWVCLLTINLVKKILNKYICLSWRWPFSIHF